MNATLEWLTTTYHSFWSIFFFGLGAIIGSFLNVVIYRLPNNLSIAWPGSHCPKCNHPISWYDNVPIFSWLILRGKCRHCHEPIAIRYPLIELSGAILLWTLFMHFGLTPYFVANAVLALMLLAISFIDLDHFYIPDVLSIPGIVLGILFSIWTAYPTWQESLLGAFLGAGILALVLVVFQKITGREGMGWGDVKLMGMLGAFCGVFSLPAILFIGSLVGIIAAGIWLASNRHSTAKEDADKNIVEQENTENTASDDDDFEIPAGAIPFGPFLSIGALCWVFGDRLIMELFKRWQELFL